MLTTELPASSNRAPYLAPCEYKTGRTLGQGSYAVVKEAVKSATGEKFAVKVISKKMLQGKEFLILNEIDILQQVSKGHPNIITLHDYFESPSNLYLVFELCQGGELFDRICERGNFYEKDAAAIVRAVIDAVAYLHEHNIVHRDLKPENLLYRFKPENTEDFAKGLVIADFGLSKIIDSQKMSVLNTTCGTPGYMAPEVLRHIPYSKPVDMWSVGVLTYFLLVGYTPFDSDHSAEEVTRVINAQYTFEPAEYWSGVSEDAKDFIRSLLKVNPDERMTALQALNHSWFKLQSPLPPAPICVAPVESTKDWHDLLPHVRDNFNARRVFRKAVDIIKAANKWRNHASSHKNEEDLQQKKELWQKEELQKIAEKRQSAESAIGHPVMPNPVELERLDEEGRLMVIV